MPNLYFCQPHAKNQGMLRAVLSLPECERVVHKRRVTYVGEAFPSPSDVSNSAADFAVLRVSPDETTSHWRPGFYRLDSDLAEINDALHELSR